MTLHSFVKDRDMKKRIAAHHAKWQAIRALRERMSKADLADEEDRLAAEAKAFLARRDADSAHPNGHIQ